MAPALPISGLTRVGIFTDLTDSERAAMEAAFSPVPVRRGEVLVRQGEEADALYFVVSGRFDVRIDGRAEPIAEIGPGAPVGEIAFLAGGTRTATVVATRDSHVARLERVAFDQLCEDIPRIWSKLTQTLARRLADQTAGRAQPVQSRPRTIAVIRAGPEPVPRQLVADLARALGQAGTVRLVTSSDLTALCGVGDPTSAAATEALNALESAHDVVLYVADQMLTGWTEKAIRQADLVLRVGVFTRDPSGTVAENELERFAAKLLGANAHRLVLVHPKRRGPQGTRHWLASRSVTMHHHVGLGDQGDVARLARFVLGRALGFVACGGGAFSAAHVGLYAALIEHGVTFDMMGGTSGGSAMAAGFAMGLSTQDIAKAIHDIFVRNKALRRYTWPRYAILDHTHFDRMLETYFGGIDIEDLWIPYFAVSTNLSRYGLHCHRTGQLWTAIRASGSIPALLPPYYTADGEMLVDGALVDNVPVRVMRAIKPGPNVVVAFEVPQLERFAVRYSDLPGRGALARKMLLPFAGLPLPDAPSLGSVLMRSLLANQQGFDQHLTVEDALLVPPLPPAMSILDWGRYGDLIEAARAWGLSEVERLRAAGVPAFAGFPTASQIVEVRPTSSRSDRK